MKILMLESSGNKKGSSNLLAEEFIRGAKESGNDVTVFDVFRAEIRPCIGCGCCGMDGPCVQKDDYENKLKPLIKETDLLVFVMPVYYYNWPAQMKAVIDRFYSFTGELTRMHKKSVLLTVAWDNTDTTFEVVNAYYKRICEYMQFRDCGSVLGKGCGTPSITKDTPYPQKAYKLGRSL
jgi:multimeric flavodoxin WrbA